MPDQMKNLLIGIFVVSALAVVVFMMLFLHPFIGDEGQILHVRFTDIDKINVGTRVLFAGKPVGEVTRIKEIEDVKTSRRSKNGDIYVYELTLGIDTSVRVFNTDRISLRTSGLLGEKSVSIDPEPLKPDQELRLVSKDEILYAEEVGSVEDTFKEFKEVADKFDLALDTFTRTLEEIKEKGIWDNLAETMENVNEISGRLADQWDDVEDTIANISDTAGNTNDLTTKMREGEGTLGKIITNDDLYLRTTSLLSKGETIMDDVNHYGVLFHLDKGWQRLRARRMNLLQKLTTPQEFRNYFNDEVNQINTSLSRVSMVLDKSSEYPVYPCLMENKEFTKVFAELLRRVEGLEEALKMYNIQLNECNVQKTELMVEN